MKLKSAAGNHEETESCYSDPAVSIIRSAAEGSFSLMAFQAVEEGGGFRFAGYYLNPPSTAVPRPNGPFYDSLVPRLREKKKKKRRRHARYKEIHSAIST